MFCTASMLEKVSQIPYLLDQQLSCWRHFSKIKVVQNTGLNILALYDVSKSYHFLSLQSRNVLNFVLGICRWHHYTHQLLFIFPYCRFFSHSLLSVGQLFRSRGNFAYEIFGHTLMKADYTMRSIYLRLQSTISLSQLFR